MNAPVSFPAASVAIDLIRADGGTQSRAQLYDSVVSDYADQIGAGATFPPVVVFFDGASYWLADGFHRHAAHVSLGLTEIDADIRQGTRRDAILFSVGANASHGLRRTNDDKRRAVMVLLNDPEWSKWSDREIARQASVGHQMVAPLRASVTGRATSERTYTDRHGNQTTMDTANIGAGQRQAAPLDERRFRNEYEDREGQGYDTPAPMFKEGMDRIRDENAMLQPSNRQPIVDLKGRDPRDFNRALHFLGTFEDYARALAKESIESTLSILTDEERLRLRGFINKIDAVHDRIMTRI